MLKNHVLLGCVTNCFDSAVMVLNDALMEGALDLKLQTLAVGLGYLAPTALGVIQTKG